MPPSVANGMLGVIGGSGFYEFLDVLEERAVETPYGAPSAPLTIGEVDGRPVAFLPRHGRRHELSPANVPYRANLWALREVGVTRLFGPCAVGSLQRHLEPGHVVVCDQLVDRTWGRADTYFDGDDVQHVSYADPYCPELRRIAVDAARSVGVTAHERGTVVVIPGPRFSTRAESAMYSSLGFDVIGMTQYPEAYLARELGLCYGTLAMVTDHDSGVDGIPPVTHEQVLAVFAHNIDSLRAALRRALVAVPEERTCACGEGPVFSGTK